jgi:hypothetical protein
MTDSRLDILAEMAYEAGYLKQVDYLSEYDDDCDNFISAIILTFEHGIYTILAIAEDDTIEVLSGACYPAIEYHLFSVTGKEPWSGAVDKKIIFTWDSVNQQGYADSIQFYFNNVDSEKYGKEEPVIIQLTTIASSLKTYKVEQIKYEFRRRERS